jgi:acetyltransferase-like isoleucine patch superfamily enzyme
MRAADALQRMRIAWYRRQWTCARVTGAPVLLAPALLAGAGSIDFEHEVTLGWRESPAALAGYSYIEARSPDSSISFGAGTYVNNCSAIISEGPGVAIGQRCLIGVGVHIYDSDFHALDAGARNSTLPRMAAVSIADDVFIGSNAIILKGVAIGSGAVVGAGAVVSSDVAAGSTVTGNPAAGKRA